MRPSCNGRGLPPGCADTGSASRAIPSRLKAPGPGAMIDLAPRRRPFASVGNPSPDTQAANWKFHRGRMKIRVESSHKAVGSLADHAARGSAGGFLAKLTDAEVRRWRVTASIWVTTCKGKPLPVQQGSPSRTGTSWRQTPEPERVFQRCGCTFSGRPGTSSAL
jgi:hypothetical protein